MRVVQNTQMHIGEVDVSRIVFDLRSRDDIPQILRGLQHLYQDLGTRAKLFALLESEVAPRLKVPGSIFPLIFGNGRRMAKLVGA